MLTYKMVEFYLRRHLFFRVRHLTELGVGLVFAVEGDPLPLKWATIQKRLQAQGKGFGHSKRAFTRPHFKAILREVGIPHHLKSWPDISDFMCLFSAVLCWISWVCHMCKVLARLKRCVLFSTKNKWVNFSNYNKDAIRS
jgi:hypothetical protein